MAFLCMQRTRVIIPCQLMGDTGNNGITPVCIGYMPNHSAASVLACPLWMYVTIGGIVGVTLVICVALLCAKCTRRRIFPFRDRGNFVRVGTEDARDIPGAPPVRHSVSTPSMYQPSPHGSPRGAYVPADGSTERKHSMYMPIFAPETPLPPLPSLPDSSNA